MKNPNLSVITICHGRETHLHNLLVGLSRSTVLPAEVIVVITEPKLALKASLYTHLHINYVHYKTQQGEPFHIGKARNLGAKEATAQQLIFLDVDCIPHRDFVKIMRESHKLNGLVMGTPRYMKKKLIDSNWDIPLLTNLSELHPHRPANEGIEQSSVYTLFWSLCFAINKGTYKKLGGFDEHYVGYGAEDTDFALMAKAHEVPFYLSPAVVFHQQHGVYSPPINHIKSITVNANYYKEKWGVWPMEGWLEDFNDFGFIDWNLEQQHAIKIKKLPTESEMKRAYRPNAPYG